MSVVGKWFPVLIVVALAITLATAQAPLPPNPHQPLNEPDACGECHEYDGETPDPHEFFVAIPEKCWECHSQKKLGLSHPIGVDPRHSPPGVVEVPDDLPLEEGEVSCGTCHNPHMAYLSDTRAYNEQDVFLTLAGVRQYKTYFLRMSDPVKGFEPLCLACHRDF